MVFDWGEYLTIARFLGDDQTQSQFNFGAEAAIRSATSRAYYAAFCSARNYAASRLSFQPNGDRSDHGRLREHFRRTNRAQIATALGQLQQWREQCDYQDDELENGADLLRGAIGRAERVIAQCR